MTKFHRIVRINHSADNLFELVSDIEKYPQFIRWIKRMDVEVISRSDTRTSLIGTAKVGFSGFSETMATRVNADHIEKTISVSLVKGPLKTLSNRWQFIAVNKNKTDVDFFVDFEFRNFFLRALASANFEFAVNQIMAAFVSEADRRYGAPGLV